MNIYVEVPALSSWLRSLKETEVWTLHENSMTSASLAS